MDAEASAAPDPERSAELAERRARLKRYLVCLSPEELEVLQYLGLLGLTVKETAVLLDRPPSTVNDQYASAQTKLRRMALESDRRAGLGRRRR